MNGGTEGPSRKDTTSSGWTTSTVASALERGSILAAVPILEVLIAVSLFPAVYLGADRLAPIEAALPVNFYYLAITLATLLALGTVLRAGYGVGRDRRVDPRSAAVFFAALAFVAWAALSLRWTVESGEYATYKLERLALFGPLLLGFGLVLARSRRRLVAFALVMGAIGVWLAAEALYATHVLGEMAFVTVGSDTYLVHGRAIGFAAPLLSGVVVARRHPAIRLVAGAMIAAALVGSATAGGRGPFVALLAALGTFVLVEGLTAAAARRVTPAGVAASVGSAIAIVGGALLMIRTLGSTPWTLERLGTVGSDSATETRLHMLEEATNLWLERPLLGHGIGSYDALTATGHEYPHNVIVETLAELGLVGFGLAALVVLPGLVASLAARVRGGSAMHTAVVALFVYMLVNACLSFDLQSNRQLFFAAGLLALGWTARNDE
ncbi:O-antigen ligase family protein [Halovivax limisalsi]|uniref:O-antigen ligase family protein n=1 Tax=Halovivax limisalsi TaxID=1453760 RepID=UPI001FFD2E4E|nr:O-antigen ligase family protein [Halovivax limisalsi]